MDPLEHPDPQQPIGGWWPLRVDRVVSTTLTLMAVLIIYDGWNELTLGGVIVVIVGPVVAIFVSHLFAAGLAGRVRTGRPLTRKEHRVLLRDESRFLLIAVPPVAILLILGAVGVSYNRAIQVIVAAGVISLGFWGGVAGRRAGLRGWPLLISVLYGLVLGGLILVLQAVLQPGGETFRP